MIEKNADNFRELTVGGKEIYFVFGGRFYSILAEELLDDLEVELIKDKDNFVTGIHIKDLTATVSTGMHGGGKRVTPVLEIDEKEVKPIKDIRKLREF